LRDATKGVAAQYTADLARAENHLQRAAEEARSLQRELADREDVNFTAAYPGRVARDLEYPLRVYLHTSAQLNDVIDRCRAISDQLGLYPRTGAVRPGQRIPVGTKLEITPRIHLVDVTPSQQVVVWAGSIEELSFRLHYAGRQQNPPPSSGFIDITTGGL